MDPFYQLKLDNKLYKSHSFFLHWSYIASRIFWGAQKVSPSRTFSEITSFQK